MFAKKYGDYTVGDIKKLNRKVRIKEYLQKIDWGAVLIYGLSLGISISTLVIVIKMFLGE